MNFTGFHRISFLYTNRFSKVTTTSHKYYYGVSRTQRARWRDLTGGWQQDAKGKPAARRTPRRHAAMRRGRGRAAAPSAPRRARRGSTRSRARAQRKTPHAHTPTHTTHAQGNPPAKQLADPHPTTAEAAKPPTQNIANSLSPYSTRFFAELNFFRV